MLINVCIIEAGGVVSAFLYENMDCFIILETTGTTYMHLQHSRCYKDCLAFKLSLFDGFFYKRQKMLKEWTRGVVSAFPEGMGHHILWSVTMALNIRINTHMHCMF